MKPRSDRRCFNLERLESRIERVTESGCWLWTGAVKPNGYGQIYGRLGSPLAEKKNYYPHRVIYELIHGPIPKHLQIDHLCRVHCCVNPHHLELVPQSTNLARGYGVGAMYARRTHCSAGHELVFPNLVARTDLSRGRECKLCHAKRERERKRAIRSGSPPCNVGSDGLCH